jgi:hypothetical protein
MCVVAEATRRRPDFESSIRRRNRRCIREWALHRQDVVFSADNRSESKAHGELHLARVEYCSRRSISWVARTIEKSSKRSRRVEYRIAIGRVEEPDVERIEDVERLGDELYLRLLGEMNCPRNTGIDASEVVALECVSRFKPDTVVDSEHIAVGVKARELGEEMRRLDCCNQTELKIARENVSLRGAGDHRVSDEAMRDVVG